MGWCPWRHDVKFLETKSVSCESQDYQYNRALACENGEKVLCGIYVY